MMMCDLDHRGIGTGIYSLSLAILIGVTVFNRVLAALLYFALGLRPLISTVASNHLLATLKILLLISGKSFHSLIKV